MSLTTAPCWMLLPLPGLQVLVGSGHMDGCSGEVVDLLPWWQWSERGWTASVSGGGALPGASWVPGASGGVDRPLPLVLYDFHPWAVAPHLRPPSFSCWDERAHITEMCGLRSSVLLIAANGPDLLDLCLSASGSWGRALLQLPTIIFKHISWQRHIHRHSCTHARTHTHTTRRLWLYVSVYMYLRSIFLYFLLFSIQFNFILFIQHQIITTVSSRSFIL